MQEPPQLAPDERLNRVAKLATSVADRILDAQITGRPIPPEQLTSLVAAARLMRDHGMDWSPLVEQVLFEFAERLDGIEGQPEAPELAPDDDDVVTGLTRFFAAFRREKGLSIEP